MPDRNVERLPKETLLKMIENAPDTRLFRSLFVRDKDTGVVEDATNNGEYSCAFFVSGLLTLAGYLPRIHGTVKGLRKKLQELNYEIISEDMMQPGDIIFWEKMMFPNGLENEHVGFVLNKETAISTSFKKQQVVSHPLVTPGGVSKEPRKITLILRAPEKTS
jgi:hypothetical protein